MRRRRTGRSPSGAVAFVTWVVVPLLVTLTTLLPLLGIANAASVLSSCKREQLLEHLKDSKHISIQLPEGGAFNNDAVPLRCEEGYEPLNASALAVCSSGTWLVPEDFKCLRSGFCRAFAQPGPSIRLVLYSSPGIPHTLTQRKDTYDEMDHLIVRCRATNEAHSYSCKDGVWSPQPDSVCATKQCLDVPTLTNGEFVRTAQDVVEPTCMEGYEVQGNNIVFCRNGKWQLTANGREWPSCRPVEQVIKTPRSPLQRLQWIALGGLVLVLIGVIVMLVTCYWRRESPKRNRLMHNTSHVDELLHLRRPKPLPIPEPVSHTQVHYTHDRKPIPVTSL